MYSFNPFYYLLYPFGIFLLISLIFWIYQVLIKQHYAGKEKLTFAYKLVLIAFFLFLLILGLLTCSENRINSREDKIG